MDDWAKARLAELEAGVEVRRVPKAKKKSDRFAVVNLKEMAAACAATNTHKAVCVGMAEAPRARDQ
jgi:hypothetical protein